MRNKLHLAGLMTAIVVASSSAGTVAQAADATEPRCPAGYWLMDSLCFSQSTGDVVLATPSTPSDEVRVPRAK